MESEGDRVGWTCVGQGATVGVVAVRLAFTDPLAAIEAAERVVQRFGVAHAERENRAAEVWQLKYERWAARQPQDESTTLDQCGYSRPLARTESVVRKGSVERATLEAAGRRPSPQGKLTRWLGGDKQHGSELQGKVVAARELALAIRKAQPGLPQTGFDRCKITSSSSRAKTSIHSSPPSRLPKLSHAISCLPEIDESPAFAFAASDCDAPAASRPSEPPTPAPPPEEEPRAAGLAQYQGRAIPPLIAPELVLDRRTSCSTPSASPRTNQVLTREQEKQYKWVVRINEVEMQTRLGAGAFGEVWAGNWRRNEVAVKQLLTGKLSDEDTNNFLLEMQTLAE
ncbi:MAG: hypothetical protein SGPRY_011796, partial [Prymnesium sp.]